VITATLQAGPRLNELRRRLGGRDVVGQTAVYAVASAAASMANGVAKGLAAAILSVPDFAVFAFSQTLLTYLALFFEFGLFLPAARACALASGDEGRDLIGTAIVLYIPVAVAFVVTVFGASFIVDDIFRVHAGHTLRAVAVISFGWPFAFVGLQLAQGVGRLHISAIVALGASLIFVGAFALARLVMGHITVDAALMCQCGGLAIGAFVLASWLRPRFVAWRSHVRPIVRDARRYGFAVYIGRVLSIGTYNMDVLMLGALAPGKAVASYVLAGAISIGAALPVVSLGNALFAPLARAERIGRTSLIAAWVVGLATVPIAWVGSRLAVDYLFSAAYQPVVTLVIPLTMASALRGVTGLYNSFLAAHGRGRALRAAGVVLTTSNLLLNFALIPAFGADGAAWASFIALLANLVAYVVGYRRAIQS